GGIDTETVDPVAGRYDGFHQTLETKIAEQLFDSGVAAVNLAPYRFTGALARQVNTALFVENRERGIAAQMEAVFAKKNSAETMDGRDGCCRKNRKDLDPLGSMPCQDSLSDAISHFGGCLFCERHRYDAKRIHSTFEQLDIHFNELPGLARAGARQHYRI